MTIAPKVFRNTGQAPASQSAQDNYGSDASCNAITCNRTARRALWLRLDGSDIAMTCGHAKEHCGPMSVDRRDEVLLRYGLPPGPHPGYEIDHLIPLCPGGSDDPAATAAQHRTEMECRRQGSAGSATMRYGLWWSGRYRDGARGVCQGLDCRLPKIHEHGAAQTSKALSAARDSLVMERKDLVTTLSKPYRRGHSEETLERFTSVQNAIASIEDAIKHEWQLAGVAQPKDTLRD